MKEVPKALGSITREDLKDRGIRETMRAPFDFLAVRKQRESILKVLEQNHHRK